MNESTQPPTAREVATARQLYWITIIAGCMIGPPPPRGSSADMILLLIPTAWIVLIVGINIRAMERSGLKRSGIVAPILTVLFIAAVVLNVWHLAAEVRDTFETRIR